MKPTHHLAYGATMAFSSMFAIAAPVLAQSGDYPTKPITLIVPFSAGGTTDVIARILAENMGSALGMPMIVENRPGASTAIGMEAAARSEPDGYTLILTSSTGLVINPVLMEVNYDPVDDFEHVGIVNEMTALLLVTPDFPANDFDELIELAKSQPGELNYADWGPGSPGALCMQMMTAATGAEMNPVTYQGGNPIVADMLGGHIDVGFTDPASAIGPVKEGRLRALASCAGDATAFPGVPSYQELGLDYEFYVRTVLAAPVGVSESIVEKLDEAFQHALTQPDILGRLADIGATPPKTQPSPAEVREIITSDVATFRQMVESGEFKVQER